MADTEFALRTAIKNHTTAKGHEGTAALIERIMSEHTGGKGPISPGKASAQELHAEMNHSTGIDPKETNPPGSAAPGNRTAEVFGKGGAEQSAEHDKTVDPKSAGPEASSHVPAGFATGKEPANTTKSNAPGKEPRTATKAPEAKGITHRGGGDGITGTGVSPRSTASESAQDYPSGLARSSAVESSFKNASGKARAAFARSRKK